MVQRVAGRSLVQGWASPFDKWKTLPVKPAVNGYLFSNEGTIRQRKERDGLRISSAVPTIHCDSNPHCPYGY